MCFMFSVPLFVHEWMYISLHQMRGEGWTDNNFTRVYPHVFYALKFLLEDKTAER